ncbi:MAG: hypothetical protein KC613_08295, partial [Myxococcales bacterium]|nr:hypothetical protein [Myxococcales bacterium]
ELDAQEQDPAKRLLFVRPAEVLKEDTHYVVAFRGLRDTDGEPIAPSAAFDAARAAVGGAANDLTPRQLLLTEWLQLLEMQGVDLATVTVAWDFHTASVDAVSGPLVAMRDEALAAAPDGPEIIIDAVEPFAPEEDGSGNPVNPYVAYRLRGSVRFPNYLKRTAPYLGKDGYGLNREGQTGKPDADGYEDQPFWAIIPRSALDGAPMRFLEYGHGLFGDGEEVLYPGWTRPCGRFPDKECGWWNAEVAQKYGYIVYGTDMIGMREEDRDERALTILTEISKFPWITDRLHQGVLNHVLLVRAMKQRFADLPEVAALDLTLDPEDQAYYGNSQGSIVGVTVTALSPDITRGYMGVAGANYSTLLHRSTGFSEFFAIFKGVYTDTREQAVGLALLQLLWDATDSISYFRRLEADPLPGSPPSQILAGTTRGDYLVTPLVYETVARTEALGIRAMAHYDDERTPDLVTLADYPRQGSALVGWHLGNPWAPPGNTPPPEHPYGDPHEELRHIDANQAQMAHFLQTGEVIDVCNGQVCPDVDRSSLDD